MRNDITGYLQLLEKSPEEAETILSIIEEIDRTKIEA